MPAVFKNSWNHFLLRNGPAGRLLLAPQPDQGNNAAADKDDGDDAELPKPPSPHRHPRPLRWRAPLRAGDGRQIIGIARLVLLGELAVQRRQLVAQIDVVRREAVSLRRAIVDSRDRS